MIFEIHDNYVPSSWLYSSMNHTDSVFLDSSMNNNLGKRSYIGIIPFKIYTPDNCNLDDTLDKIGDSTLMGFISYDYGMESMGCISDHPASGIPLFVLADFDIVIEENICEKNLVIVCKGRVMSEKKEREYVLNLIDSCKQPHIPLVPPPESVEFTDGESFVESVKKAKQYEKDGEFYVINLSRRIRVKSSADPYDVFMRLRNISPSPYGAFLNLSGISVISSSMELLLEIDNGNAWTRPIKGTSPRTGNTKQDEISLEKLLSSEKDREELLMVTDMERNDMNLFCIPGSVKVDGFFIPEAYSTLYHTVSDITGRIKNDVNLGYIVSCMFPGGSVTGAPKKACIENIDKLEDSRRGMYTGSVCLFSKKRTVMNIAIRTMTASNGLYEIGVGGGITYRSDEYSELEETIQKGKALMYALGVEDESR